MAQKILGIDIGTHSVKLVLVERSFSEFQVLRFIEQPLNMQTRLSHEELVAVALEQTFQAHDLKADVISVSFPGQYSSNRVLEFPFTNSKKLSQVVEFELEGYVPFAVEDLVFDFHVLNKSENTSKILCVYIPQEKFGSYLESLNKAGVDPKYFGSDVTDLAGIAQVAMVPQDDTYVICDIGHSKTNICIMQGTELKYARTLGVGGLHFTRAIQRTFNVNYEKAESLKLSRGRIYIREQDTDQIARILDHVAMELVSAIKQTFLGFDNTMGIHSIPAIYCTGGGSRLNGLLDFLSFHLRCNVLELDALNIIPHELEDTADANIVMAQALANAIRPIFSNRMPKINFRKGAFAFKQDIQMLTSELKYVGVLMGVIAILGAGYYFYSDYYYTQKMAAIDTKIEKVVSEQFPDIKSSRRGDGNLSRYLRQAKSRLTELKTQASAASGESQISVLQVMQELSEVLPPKNEVRFEISEFNFSDDFVRVNARTNDPLNVQKIVATLKESGKFPNVEATDPQAKPNNLWDFTMKMDFKESATAQDDEE